MTRLIPYPWAGREWIPVLVLTLLAAGLRLDGLGRLGIDHFDEGIYATVGAWSLSREGLYGISPDVIAYAPPGYPILVGIAYLFLGPTDTAAILVSILAGTATIPVVAWLARRTFGRDVGVAAAGLAFTSGLHITFSRMALTDATFLLVWLVAMGLGVLFLERPGPLKALAFGVSVGVAQLVKYNGWLVGAIVALTALLGPVVSREERRRARLTRVFGWGLLAAVAAALTYAPWFRFVEGHGGYRRLLDHQRSYLGTLGSWPTHLWTQLQQVAALAPGGRRYVPGAVAMIAPMAYVLTKRGLKDSPPLVFGILVLALLLLMGPTSGWWLGLGLAPYLLRAGTPGRRLVGTWWVALTVLTPLYHPYARLWLPLDAAGWLIGGLAIATVFGWTNAPGRWPDRGYFRENAAIIAVAAVGLVASRFLPPAAGTKSAQLPTPYGEPRDSFRIAVARIVELVPPEAGVVRVLARPPFFFYGGGRLGARGVAVSRVGSLEDIHKPGSGWAIVDEVQLRQGGDIDKSLARLMERWEIAADVATTLSNATLLDVDPSAAAGNLSARDERLYLLRPRRGKDSP